MAFLIGGLICVIAQLIMDLTPLKSPRLILVGFVCEELCSVPWDYTNPWWTWVVQGHSPLSGSAMPWHRGH